VLAVSYYYDKLGVTAALDNSVFARGAAAGDKFVSVENLYGSSDGNDNLSGNKADNNIVGFGGHDRLNGKGGIDFLDGGDGDDMLIGGGGSDFLHGGAGRDRLIGNGGSDSASYFYSDEGVTVSLDKSLIATGDAVGDTFTSIENLVGSSTASDVLAGNKKANSIWGFGGDDTINGGKGNDQLYGGEGSDTFVFSSAKHGTDTIHDFNAYDKIAFDAEAFGLVAGAVGANQFRASAGHASLSQTEVFLFDTTDKSLWFDQDGSGAGAAVRLAVLGDNADLWSGQLLLV
jgi:Ca2+-binding RTX toxin-like protein